MQQRYAPLDVFRGLTLIFMIIVNTPGSWVHLFTPLEHAHWNGFTPTDLVFPAFLFAVGNAMAFVSVKWKQKTAKQLFLKGFKRFFLIFLIGYLGYWFPFISVDGGDWNFIPISETRIFGVLQRIGFCYAIALPFIYYLTPKKIIFSSVGILLLYWFLLSIGGDLSMENNAVVQLDLRLLGADHLYMGEGIPFDPEGILSSLPAVVNIFVGYLIGLMILRKKVDYQTLSRILLIGIGLLFAGFLWNYVFPINKKLWTSSYVLLSSGLSTIILGGIIYYMDFTTPKKCPHIFIVFGKNPLFLYVLSGVLATLLWFFGWYTPIYENAFAWMGGKLGSLVFALVFTSILGFVAWYLDRRKIYIKL